MICALSVLGVLQARADKCDSKPQALVLSGKSYVFLGFFSKMTTRSWLSRGNSSFLPSLAISQSQFFVLAWGNYPHSYCLFQSTLSTAASLCAVWNFLCRSALISSFVERCTLPKSECSDLKRLQGCHKFFSIPKDLPP